MYTINTGMLVLTGGVVVVGIKGKKDLTFVLFSYSLSSILLCCKALTVNSGLYAWNVLYDFV